MSPFRFATPRPARRPSLTPMIDVVFLLLVFFMLVSRFGAETVLSLSPPAQSTAQWVGPPRLVAFAEDGLRLNGASVAPETLAGQLLELMQGPDDPILLRADETAPVQALVDLIDRLGAAGLRNVILVE